MQIACCPALHVVNNGNCFIIANPCCMAESCVIFYFNLISQFSVTATPISLKPILASSFVVLVLCPHVT